MRAGASRPPRKLITALALAALSLRALVPAGFMPAPGRPLSLELCPDGLPGDMPMAGMLMPGMLGPGMDHEHAGRAPPARHPAQIEHCVFGGASGLALLTHPPALGVLLSAYVLPAVRFAPQRTGLLLLCIPLPRGPPAPV
jgi:hypothetical protein